MSVNFHFDSPLRKYKAPSSASDNENPSVPVIPYRQLLLSDVELQPIKKMNGKVALSIVNSHCAVRNTLTQIGDNFFSSEQSKMDELLDHFINGTLNSDLDYLVRNMNALPCLFYKLLYEDHKFRNPRSEFSVLRYIIGTDLTECSVDDLCYILGNVVREVQDLGDDKWSFMEVDMIRQIMSMQGLDKYPNPKLYDGIEHAIGFYLFVSMVDFRLIKAVSFKEFFLKSLEWHPELRGSLIGVLEYCFGCILGTKVSPRTDRAKQVQITVPNMSPPKNVIHNEHVIRIMTRRFDFADAVTVGNLERKPGQPVFKSEYSFHTVQLACKCAMSTYLLRWYERQIFVDLPGTLSPAAKVICTAISDWATGSHSYSELGVRYGLDFLMVTISHMCSGSPRLENVSRMRKSRTITSDRSIDFSGRAMKYAPLYKLEAAGIAMKQVVKQLAGAISDSEQLPANLRRQAKMAEQMCERPLFDIAEIVHDMPAEERKGRGRPPKEQRPPILLATPSVDRLQGAACCSKTINTDKSTAFKSTLRGSPRLGKSSSSGNRSLIPEKRKATETISRVVVPRKASQKALSGILRSVAALKDDGDGNKEHHGGDRHDGGEPKDDIPPAKKKSLSSSEGEEAEEEKDAESEGSFHDDDIDQHDSEENDEEDFVVKDDDTGNHGEDGSYIPESTCGRTDSTLSAEMTDEESESVDHRSEEDDD